VQQGPTQAGCVYQPEGDCAAGVMPVSDVVVAGITLLSAREGIACPSQGAGSGTCLVRNEANEVLFFDVWGGRACAGAMQPNGCAVGVAPVSDQQWTYLGCP
jgi:hypothetical protein